jgi:hypothetical protein
MYAAQGDMVYVGVAAHQTLPRSDYIKAIEPVIPHLPRPCLRAFPHLPPFKISLCGPMQMYTHHPPHEPS